ncbi:MAG TPA: hypothetical protein VLE73_04250 [Candidatus Saccharimonadales bacterium]|nr:hypothetical protein [Candidatus Saccharimonadales bacterium]
MEVPPQLLLAEQLTADQVSVLNRYPIRDDHRHGKAYSRATRYLELALCLPEPEEQEEALRRAAIRFTKLQESSRTYGYMAGIFLDYMPVYARRIEQLSQPSMLRRQLYGQLGKKALGLELERPGRDLGRFYETVFLGLCAGMEDERYFAFPASVREEATSPKSANYNHDAYWLQSGKIPVQLKSARSHGGQAYKVPIIRVRDCLLRSAIDVYGKGPLEARPRAGPGRTYTMPPDRMGKLFRLTGELMVADAQQQTIPEADAAYLTSLQGNIQKRIRTVWSTYSLPVIEA